MGFVILTDDKGFDHLVHTSQINPQGQKILDERVKQYHVEQQDQWRRVWEDLNKPE